MELEWNLVELIRANRLYMVRRMNHVQRAAVPGSANIKPATRPDPQQPHIPITPFDISKQNCYSSRTGDPKVAYVLASNFCSGIVQLSPKQFAPRKVPFCPPCLHARRRCNLLSGSSFVIVSGDLNKNTAALSLVCLRLHQPETWLPSCRSSLRTSCYVRATRGSARGSSMEALSVWCCASAVFLSRVLGQEMCCSSS